MSGTERLSCNSKVTMQHKAYVFAGPSKTKYGDSIGYIDPGDTVCIYWRYGEFYFVEYPVTGGVKTGYTLKTEFNDVPNFNPNDIGLMPQVNPGYRYVGISANSYYSYKSPFPVGKYLTRGQKVYYQGIKENGYALLQWTINSDLDGYGWFYANNLSTVPQTD